MANGVQANNTVDVIALFYAITLIPFADDYALDQLYFNVFDENDRQFVTLPIIDFETVNEFQHYTFSIKYTFLHNSTIMYRRLEKSYVTQTGEELPFNLTKFLFWHAKQYRSSEHVLQAGVVCHRLVNISQHRIDDSKGISMHQSLVGTYAANFTSENSDAIFHHGNKTVFVTYTCDAEHAQLKNRFPGMFAAGSQLPPYFPIWDHKGSVISGYKFDKIYYRGLAKSRVASWNLKGCENTYNYYHQFQFYRVSITKKTLLRQWLNAYNQHKQQTGFQLHQNLLKQDCRLLCVFNYTTYLGMLDSNVERKPIINKNVEWAIVPNLEIMPAPEDVFYGRNITSNSTCLDNCMLQKACHPACNGLDTNLALEPKKFVKKTGEDVKSAPTQRYIAFKLTSVAAFEERRAIALPDFFGGLGGIFGLLLGASVISFAQVAVNILIFVVISLSGGVCRPNGQNKNLVTTEKFLKDYRHVEAVHEVK